MDRNQLLNDSETALRVAMDGRQATLWTALPAMVVTVNWDAMTLIAQPTIMGVVTNPDDTESYVKLPLLVDVPICFPSGGGFTLTFPLKMGDEILVIFASRCIDAWFQSGGIGIPMETRMHDLSDGFAIPGPKSQPRTIANISTANMQLRANDGTTYIEITPDGVINLVNPSGLNIEGDVSVSGNITASGDVKAGLISLKTHTHTSAAPGTPTGPPLP